MAQIYKAKVNTDRTPLAPDTSGIQAIGRQTKVTNALVSRQADIEQQQANYDRNEEQKAFNSTLNLAQSQGVQAINEASSIYENNPAKFTETWQASVKKIMDTLPDSDERTNLMAKLQIAGNATMTKVEYRARKVTENKQKANFQQKISTQLEIGINNVGFNVGSIGIDTVPTEMAMKMDQQYADAEMMATEAYSHMDDLDENGNYKFNAQQRASAKKLYDNRYYNATLARLQDMHVDDPKGTVQAMKTIRDNPRETMEALRLDAGQYDKLVVASEKIVNGETTATIEKNEQMISVSLAEYDINKGVPENTKTRMVDIFGTINTMEELYAEKELSKAFYNENIVNLKATYYKMDETQDLYEKQKPEHSWYTPIWKKMPSDTGGTLIEKFVDKITVGIPDDMVGNAKRFDLTREYNNVLIEAGIDPNSPDSGSVDKAENLLLKQNAIQAIKLYGATPEDLSTPDTYKVFMTEQREKVVIQKTNAALGLANDPLEGFDIGSEVELGDDALANYELQWGS